MAIKQSFYISPIYEALIRDIWELSIATAVQLTWLEGYSQTSVKQTKKYLHTLAERGYVQMDAVSIPNGCRPNGVRTYKSLHYYALGAQGAK